MHLGRLVDALTRRHAELVAEAASLRRALDASPAVSDRLRGVFGAFADAVAFHVQREERFLFPGIRALEHGEPEARDAVRGTMRRLELEHRDLLALEGRLREMAHEACEIAPRVLQFLAAYEQHDAVEDQQLLPLVDAALAGGDRAGRSL